MSVFDFFKSKPNSGGSLPPEVAKIFDKLHRFLTDEKQQNAQLPPQLRVVVEGGASIDEVLHGTGPFGLSLTNPNFP